MAEERVSSRQPLGQVFVLCGAKQKEAEASSYKAGSEPGGTVSEQPGQTSRVSGKGDCRFSAKGCHSLG